MGSVVAAIAIGAGAAVTAGGALYAGKKASDAAKDRSKMAKRDAEIAREREERELRIQREQTDRELQVATEQAEWETGISLEKAEFTKERIQEEADLVTASQIVGYAAAGISVSEGSPINVMARTAKTAEIQKDAVMRGHEVFAETRSKGVAEIEASGEAAYEWFSERLKTETGYDIEHRKFEARAYKDQARSAKYGSYFSAGASLLGGAADAYTIANN